MLERIVNISAGSDYKQSSKPGARSRASRHLSEYQPVGNDSISLSPATAYLSIIGWKLKKIQLEKEKLQIEFTFDDLDFATAINPSEIFHLQKIEYSIKYSVGAYAGLSELNIRIDSPFVLENSQSIQIERHLTELKQFFNSIESSFGYKSNVSSDSYEVQNIFSEMGNALQREFHYVNNRLLSFLEKFLSLKINATTNNAAHGGKLTLKFLQIIKPDV